MKRWLIGAGVALALIAVVIGVRWLTADRAQPAPLSSSSDIQPATAARAPSALPSTTTAPPTPVVAVDPPLPPMPESSVDAAASMAQARQFGDPRTPPIMRTETAERPSEQELADPELYQKYEERQHKRLIGAYLKATADELPKLEADIEKAKAAGLPEEQIQEGLEKQRRMQQMRDQLMAEHPDIAR